MKKIITVLVFSLLFFASCNNSFHGKMNKNYAGTERLNNYENNKVENFTYRSFQEPTEESSVPGYVIVRTAKTMSAETFTKRGFKVCGRLKLDTCYYWHLYKDTSTRLIEASRIPGVQHAEYDYAISAPAFTVNSRVGKKEELMRAPTTSLDPVDDAVNYNLEITQAFDAYKDPLVGYGPDSNTTFVAIIDTGTNAKHRDLSKPILYMRSCAFANLGFLDVDDLYIGDGNSFQDVPITENPDVSSGHGTHCSGTICADGTNDKDISGVAWKNTRLISYQGLGAAGGGMSWSIYGALIDLANKVEILKKDPAMRTDEEKAELPYADKLPTYFDAIQIKQKTVPVNMSLGGSFASPFNFHAIMYAMGKDILPVIAMGNEGHYTNSYPAAFPGVLAVGATDGKDAKAGFSTSGSWISVSAPGVAIESCLNRFGILGGDASHGTQNMSGTSMATPFVTGTIGYLLSFDNARNMSAYQIKTLLEETADDIAEPGFDYGTGHGRVNVYKAAKRIVENDIPAENLKYSEKTVTVRGFNKGKPVVIDRLTLIDDKNIPVFGIGSYDANPITFRGLKTGVTYKGNALFADEVKPVEFTVGNEDIDVRVDFDVNLIWISTTMNLAYFRQQDRFHMGHDDPDVVFTVYKAEPDGSCVKSDDNLVLEYDMNRLDTTYFKPEPGAAYYVVVDGFHDPDTKRFRGGNYIIKIGDSPISDLDDIYGAAYNPNSLMTGLYLPDVLPNPIESLGVLEPKVEATQKWEKRLVDINDTRDGVESYFFVKYDWVSRDKTVRKADIIGVGVISNGENDDTFEAAKRKGNAWNKVFACSLVAPINTVEVTDKVTGKTVTIFETDEHAKEAINFPYNYVVKKDYDGKDLADTDIFYIEPNF